MATLPLKSPCNEQRGEDNTEIVQRTEDVTIMTPSSEKFLCALKITFPTKIYFGLFLLLELMEWHHFVTYLSNDSCIIDKFMSSELLSAYKKCVLNQSINQNFNTS